MKEKSPNLSRRVLAVTIFCLPLLSFQAKGSSLSCADFLISKRFSQPQEQRIQSIVSQLERLVSPLKAPSPLFEVAEDGFRTAFITNQNTVYVGFRSRGEELGASTFRTILAHEYGHAVFHENLSLNLNGKTYSMKQLDYRLDRDQSLFYLNRRLRVYHEFFADLLAALDAGDGKVMSQLLETQVSAAFERDFTRPFTFSQAFNSYNVLGPSRVELWSDYVEGNSKRYSLILQSFLQAAKDHLEIQYRRGDYLVPFSSLSLAEVKDLNREFIRIFRKTYNDKLSFTE